MLMSSKVKEKVVETVSRHLSVTTDKVKMESRFEEDFGADSLEKVDIILELEEEFEMKFPDDAPTKLESVGSLVEFIEATKGS
jgi:acyl carrier protein